MTTQKQPLHKRLLASGGWALFTVFVWELIEEGLESLIAMLLSSAVALFAVKTLSTIGIVFATQGVKTLIKKTLYPVFKSITYKEGHDKMSKVKKFFTWIWANKKTLGGIGSSAVMVLSGSGVIDVATLPALNISGFNITPILYYAVLGILALIGVSGKGFESIATFFNRLAEEKKAKDQKAIVKIAEKEMKAEEKLANQTQAEQEKAKAKAEADAKAKAEKEKAEAEKRAKIEQAKADLKAKKQNA